MDTLACLSILPTTGQNKPKAQTSGQLQHVQVLSHVQASHATSLAEGKAHHGMSHLDRVSRQNTCAHFAVLVCADQQLLPCTAAAASQ